MLKQTSSKSWLSSKLWLFEFQIMVSIETPWLEGKVVRNLNEHCMGTLVIMAVDSDY